MGPAVRSARQSNGPDHTRLVAEGRGRGYIEHPYRYGGHSYYSRAYYYRGGYYRGYCYHGVYLNGYLPAYYYPPAFYEWAYAPWPTPVYYTWGWAASPWYGYYGPYFAPYPVYPSAAYWITDYMMAANLANAYAGVPPVARLQHTNQPHLVYASYDPSASDAAAPATSTEVKDAVTEEIKRELANQKTQAGTDNNVASLATLLEDGKPHVFVDSAALTVTSSGQECALTEGDVLALSTVPAADAAAPSSKSSPANRTTAPKVA